MFVVLAYEANLRRLALEIHHANGSPSDDRTHSGRLLTPIHLLRHTALDASKRGCSQLDNIAPNFIFKRVRVNREIRDLESIRAVPYNSPRPFPLSSTSPTHPENALES